jgi:hypothetical protein
MDTDCNQEPTTGEDTVSETPIKKGQIWYSEVSYRYYRITKVTDDEVFYTPTDNTIYHDSINGFRACTFTLAREAPKKKKKNPDQSQITPKSLR